MRISIGSIKTKRQHLITNYINFDFDNSMWDGHVSECGRGSAESVCREGLWEITATQSLRRAVCVMPFQPRASVSVRARVEFIEGACELRSPGKIKIPMVVRMLIWQ